MVQATGHLRRRGFTLVELLVACGVSAVLMGAIGSVLVVAGRAVPSSRSAETVGAITAASAALERIASDLATALVVTGDGATVRATVPDRDSDGNADLLEYTFKGDGAVYCSLNGGANAVLVDGVQSFAVRFGTVDETTAAGLQDVAAGGESLLRSQDATVASRRINVHRNEGVGSTFWPAAATGPYTISRVRLRLRESGSNDSPSSVAVRVYMADSSGAPTGSPLAESYVNERSLDTSTPWRSVTLSGAVNIPPTCAVCIVVMAAVGDNPAEAVYEDTPPAGSVMWRTTNGGGSWTARSGDLLALEVFGSYGGWAETTSILRLVESVTLDMAVGNGKAAVPLSRTVRLLNRPEAQ